MTPSALASIVGASPSLLLGRCARAARHEEREAGHFRPALRVRAEDAARQRSSRPSRDDVGSSAMYGGAATPTYAPNDANR